MTCCVDKVASVTVSPAVTACYHHIGDVESTMPTKLLMEIAEYVDTHGSELKDWILNNKEEVMAMLADEDSTKLASSDVPSQE